MKKYFLYGVLSLLILTSCNVEKRHFTGGYSLFTHGKADAVKTNDQLPTEKQNVAVLNNEQKSEMTASDVSTTVESKEAQTVVSANQTTVSEKSVSPVATREVKNNKVEKKDSRSVSPLKSAKRLVASVAVAGPAGLLASGKSQLIALLLCIFVGGLGIHRFYLGYTTIGIIQLLTGGGCGVWALIDLIRIITGDLKPKDGRYTETL